MNFTGKSRTKCCWSGKDYFSMMVLSVMLLFFFAEACLAAEGESMEHYKMLSTIEYAGKGQFVNQVETLFTVRKEFLSDNKMKYFISTGALDLVGKNWGSGQESRSGELAFILDRRTQQLLDDARELGTPQFSRMARLAFIGNQYLKGLVSRGVISDSAADSFVSTIETVTSELNNDFSRVISGELSVDEFIELYGHLRPGSYDITKLPYSKNPGYFRLEMRASGYINDFQFVINSSIRCFSRLLPARFLVLVYKLLRC